MSLVLLSQLFPEFISVLGERLNKDVKTDLEVSSFCPYCVEVFADSLGKSSLYVGAEWSLVSWGVHTV